MFIFVCDGTISGHNVFDADQRIAGRVDSTVGVVFDVGRVVAVVFKGDRCQGLPTNEGGELKEESGIYFPVRKHEVRANH